jgi:hypothetical protein
VRERKNFFKKKWERENNKGRIKKMGEGEAWLSRGRFRTDGRSDDGRGGIDDLDAL